MVVLLGQVEGGLRFGFFNLNSKVPRSFLLVFVDISGKGWWFMKVSKGQSVGVLSGEGFFERFFWVRR